MNSKCKIIQVNYQRMGSEFQWRHKACGDIFQLLDREVYDLLQALGVYGTEKEYDDNVHQILDVWDRILFERVEGELDQDRIDVTETYHIILKGASGNGNVIFIVAMK